MRRAHREDATVELPGQTLAANSPGARPACRGFASRLRCIFGKPFGLSRRTGFRQCLSNPLEIEICPVYRCISLLPPQLKADIIRSVAPFGWWHWRQHSGTCGRRGGRAHVPHSTYHAQTLRARRSPPITQARTSRHPPASNALALSSSVISAVASPARTVAVRMACLWMPPEATMRQGILR